MPTEERTPREPGWPRGAPTSSSPASARRRTRGTFLSAARSRSSTCARTGAESRSSWPSTRRTRWRRRRCPRGERRGYASSAATDQTPGCAGGCIRSARTIDLRRAHDRTRGGVRGVSERGGEARQPDPLRSIRASAAWSTMTKVVDFAEPRVCASPHGAAHCLLVREDATHF
jgi:hypothetical protein